MEFLWDLLIWLVMVAHLFLTPYTKVEESFNLQAIHDALRSPLKDWDHLQFPGVVPRSFLGALLTALLASPFQAWPSTTLLRLVRLILGSLSALSLTRLRCALEQTYGRTTARLFALILVCQFHLPFYMSRSLPNVFALQLASLAHAELLEPATSGYRCLMLLSLAAAIFRCDLLLLIAPVGLLLLYQKRVSFLKAAALTAAAAALGAGVSILVDSFLWQRWLWPEFEVLWFNTAENKSSEWGTQPFLWYFYSALPRGLLGALPLAALALLLEPRARAMMLVAISFIFLYSFLPHKELRFLFPVLPLCNAAAACGASRLLRQKQHIIGILTLAALLLGSGLVTVVMTCASFSNYPGGLAMTGLHHLETSSNISVHIGNLAAMSGVSRFLEREDWSYSKEEGLEKEALAARDFDWLISEFQEVPNYQCMAQVEGFQGLRKWPPAVRRVPQIFLLRKGETKSCQGVPSWNAVSHPEYQTLR